jgi:hypothetical protein
MRGIQRAATLLVGVGALGCQPTAKIAPAPAAPTYEVTVADVLTIQALVGEMVNVWGRCLGKNDATVAQGLRPNSREAWQIEDNGTAAWVVGPMPESCKERTTAMITARVVQDTIPKWSQPRWVRQYLVMR